MFKIDIDLSQRNHLTDLMFAAIPSILGMTTRCLAKAMVLCFLGMSHMAMGQVAEAIELGALEHGIVAVGFLSLEDLETSKVNDMASWFDEVDQTTYLLVGCENGTAFVRLLPGGKPIYMGKLLTASLSSVWRDIKVVNNHAYVVCEADNHGMQVFALNDLREWQPADGPQSWEASGFTLGPGTAHNLAVNEDAGHVIQVGSPWMSGGGVIYSVSSPNNPVLIGGASEWGSFHDAHAFRYAGPDGQHQGKDLIVAAGTHRMWILDASQPDDVLLISNVEYPDPAYAHQVWVSEGHDHAFMGDELDEIQLGGVTRTFVFDLTDLDNPVFVETFFSTSTATDHNQYPHGEWLFQSNYHAGLRMLSDAWPSTPTLTERGHFDPYPETDAPGFHGAWSHSILAEEGLVAMTSIEQGLWVLKPQFATTQDIQITSCNDGQPNQWNFTVQLELGWAFPVLVEVEDVQWPGGASSSWLLPAPGSYALGFQAYGVPGARPRLHLTSQRSEWPLDLLTPEASWPALYVDADGDGFGDPFNPIWGCGEVEGTSTLPLDCQDWNANTYPNAPELCDGWDNDCNLEVDEGTSQLPWYIDADGDGYGNDALEAAYSCVPLVNRVLVPGDCNDDRPDMYPGAAGTFNGVDNDCSGSIQGEEWATCVGDFDMDGIRTISDMLHLLSAFGCTGGCTASMNAYDSVVIDDLLIYLGVFGAPCN